MLSLADGLRKLQHLNKFQFCTFYYTQAVSTAVTELDSKKTSKLFPCHPSSVHRNVIEEFKSATLLWQ